jgi:hypothetical protein
VRAAEPQPKSKRYTTKITKGAPSPFPLSKRARVKSYRIGYTDGFAH